MSASSISHCDDINWVRKGRKDVTYIAGGILILLCFVEGRSHQRCAQEPEEGQKRGKTHHVGEYETND